MDADAPGGFSAVAATGAYSASWHRTMPPAAWIPLPVAVLVHADHRPDTYPVGVGVPRHVDGTIVVDCVLGSRSRRAWRRVCRGDVGVSVLVTSLADHYETSRGTVVDRAVLVGVDLVARPSDPGSGIECIRRTLSPERRQVQRRFDAWLDRQREAPGAGFLYSAAIDDADAMDELADIVAPLNELVAGKR